MLIQDNLVENDFKCTLENLLRLLNLFCTDDHIRNKLLLLINERKFAEGAIETLSRRENEYLKKMQRHAAESNSLH